MSATPVQTPGTHAAPQGARVLRGFIPLSELADTHFTVRDLLRLIPAMLISVVFNVAVLVALLWFNALTQAQSGSNQPVTTELAQREETTSEVLPEEVENSPINPFVDDVIEATPDVPQAADLELPSINPSDETTNRGIEVVQNVLENLPEGIGSGNEGGVQGNNMAGPEGLRGLLLYTENARRDYGALGEGGGLPIGFGLGLPGGGGGGSPNAGGIGVRAGRNLDLVRKLGGTDESEAAVARGLQWLARHQSPDGRWSGDKYHLARPGCRCRTPAEQNVGAHDVAMTGFALLAFLGAGHAHMAPEGAKNVAKESPYRNNVLRGLMFLIQQQDSRGKIGKGSTYETAIATIALCEAYAMTRDPRLQGPAQRAINYLVSIQHPVTGGWRYGERDPGDTSVVGWCVMALRSGQMGGLHVPSSALDGARRFLDRVAGKITIDGKEYSKAVYGYTDPGGTPVLTSVGLLCRQYLGWGPLVPDLHAGCKYLLARFKPPDKDKVNNPRGLPLYGWYYATQVMHHMEGKYFEEWNPNMRDLLIKLQEKADPASCNYGSWPPEYFDYGSHAGRIYSTSLCILTLEVYYRHLPMYRRMELAE
ncbi:MAG: terpene cyclase/mutase family protein [Gemmatales bacterium]|nr:terpene cyclase/mutase family protein [Gemmatales bacterium]MDW7995388.1 terpene cyclase/mutase family protein [Gemmatales bacterium]